MKQYVTFKVDEDLFGIDVLMVREVNRVLDITPVPKAPPYVRGLVNLRGQTVTVFDLGICLGLAPRTITEASHNVVLKQDLVGLLVDSIGNMVQCSELDIEPPPANSGSLKNKLIEGVMKLDRELLVILGTKRLLEHQES